MAEIIIMPKLGFNMDEGQLVKWHRRVGETVKKGEVLFEINTDKTTMPVEATADGTVLQLMLEEGAFAEVFTPIAVIGAPGEDPNAVLNGPATPQAAPASKQHKYPFFCGERPRFCTVGSSAAADSFTAELCMHFIVSIKAAPSVFHFSMRTL